MVEDALLRYAPDISLYSAIRKSNCDQPYAAELRRGRRGVVILAAGGERLGDAAFSRLHAFFLSNIRACRLEILCCRNPLVVVVDDRLMLCRPPLVIR